MKSFFKILFNIDDDDDEEEEEGDSMNINISSGAMEKNSEIKRDDSRRRAAHTAAEQKRRNSIRVIWIKTIQDLIFVFLFY